MWQEQCSGSILSEDQDGEWGQDDGKWKGAMHVYSLALEFGKHTLVQLIAISCVSGAILKVLSSCVKQSLHRLRQALGLQEVEAPKISRHLAHKGGKASTLHTSRHQPL